MDAFGRRLRDLPSGALAAMLAADRAQYTAAALVRAEAEAERRGLDVSRPLPSDPAPMRCPSCQREAPALVREVFLPATGESGVAPFETRTC